jgi:integrase
MAEIRISGEAVEFIFPGQLAHHALSNMALAMVLRRMKRADLTVHGFRSCFRDWCAESTGFPPEVAEMALAHTVGNKVEAAYRRGDLFEKRIQLMAAWADFVEQPRGKAMATVTAIRAA